MEFGGLGVGAYPAGQRKHSVCEPMEYVPALQMSPGLVVSGHACPGGHVEQRKAAPSE